MNGEKETGVTIMEMIKKWMQAESMRKKAYQSLNKMM